ncbi:GTPase domain-containing protein [Thioalkalicoccus limnaeus]|uniref:GTPase domain-containing protein n=1 Tax=Thioalkalicoccus limnaeus TaxID=120681 RepID=A0ABV4BD05_9GAMM
MKAKDALRHIDPLRLLALGLLIAPPLALFGLGMLWLWQTGSLYYWLAALLLCGAAGYGLQHWLQRRDRRLLAEASTEPDPDWPPRAEVVWRDVEALAEGLDWQDWPLTEGPRLIELGRLTLERVARHYHPKAEQPLLELTVPHTLLILERACRDLRRDIAEQIPFSHRLTLGDLIRIQRWKGSAEQAFRVYRVGRLVVNPVDALISETWRSLREQGTGVAQAELQGWFLRALVRKIGFYAIDLYSGRLPLTTEDPTAAPSAETRADLARAAATPAPREPLRILVLGRANAGKSSLINALLDRPVAAADTLADTTREFYGYPLVREGLTEALVIDTPGLDGNRVDEATLIDAALAADLILWVSPAHRPDRQAERALLEKLRAAQAARPEHRPPPLLVALSHVDQLRPARDWQPPYDLREPTDQKGANIQSAVAAVASDLAIPLERVVPVVLTDERRYNIDDGLWATILDQQDQAVRTRLLRCLDARRRAENWDLLRRQMIGAGRLLMKLPARFKASQTRQD